MEIEFRKTKKYLVISIYDKLDSLNAKDIDAKIEEELKKTDKDVVFDFEKLNYISSAGLQILVSCAKNRKAISKDVFIHKPNDMINNVIKVTGFYSFIKKISKID